VSGRLEQYLWAFVLALPSTYLLAASSNQFKHYSPLVISPTYWYVGMVLTGIVTYAYIRDLRRLAYAGALIVLVNVVGYVGVYYASVWIMSGREMASLMLNVMLQPAVLYTSVGALLLMIGFALGVLVIR